MQVGEDVIEHVSTRDPATKPVVNSRTDDRARNHTCETPSDTLDDLEAIVFFIATLGTGPR